MEIDAFWMGSTQRQVKYRRAIDDFLAQAAAGVAGPPHLLLLDKTLGKFSP